MTKVKRGKISTHMTPEEFQTIMKSLWPEGPKYHQDMQASRFFRRDPRTIRRWKYGELPISAETAMLLRTIVKYQHEIGRIHTLGDLK